MNPHPMRREIDPEKEDRYPAHWAPCMSDAHFNCFRDLAKTHAGISLPGQKRNMVYRRISKRLASLGLKDFGTYCNLLSGPGASTELPHFINALTTNKTAFFREKHHFEHLTSVVLPAVRQRTIKHVPTKLRIWSAGCSSGPEAYSIAMVLVETLGDLSRWDAKILATDIDTDMIEIGRSGVYSNAEMLAVPEKMRRKFVEPVPGEPDRGRLSNALRSLVTFNRLNLHAPWPMTGKFDAIFCRNVIIYFDVPDQRRLFDRFADLLCEGGHVYIGHSESLYKVTDRFRPMGQSIYQRVS